MKKVLAIVLAFAMLLPVLSVNVFADEVRKDVFTYDFNSQQITGYTGVLGDSIADFVEAIQMEGAEVELEYTVQTEGWIQISLQGNGNTYVDGSVTSEEPAYYQTGNVVYLDGAVSEEPKYFTISGTDFANNFTSLNDTVCAGLWDGSHNGDYYRGFVLDNVQAIVLNTSGALTIMTLKVTVPGGVCTINENEYESITAALDAAVSGDTITVTADSEGTGFVIPENVTLDMNGYDYTITAADSSARITTAESIVVEGTLIIDGTVTATEGQPAITIKEGANVTIAEGAVVEGDIVFDVTAENIDTFFETTNIKVTGGEVNGNFPSVEDLVALYEPTQYETAVNVGLYVGGPGNDAHSDVSITGPGEYTLTTTNPGESKDWVILKAVDGSNNTYNTGIAEGTKIVTTKMTINGTTDVIFKEGNTVETYAIGSNGVIEVIYHLVHGGPTDYITNMPDDLNTVTVNFTVDPDNYISDETLTTTIQNAVSVTGGKFSDSTDIQDYLSDGYTVDGSGNVIVAPTDPIVVTNSTSTTHYKDMETALANVQDGDTITLRNNVEVHKMVDITVSNVILDLGGFTLTAADDFSCTMGNKNDAHVINISANGVTVRNGTVKATANNKHAINVYQVDGAVLENVTADHTDSTTGAPIVIGGSDVTVKGRLTTITGMNSWYAINVDSYAGMESNITFAQNSTVAFEGVSPLGIYIETNSTADTDDVTVTFDKNVSVIAPEGVSDFTAVATDENATNASVVNPGNAGLKDNGDGTYGVAPIETSKKISGCIYLNEDYHALIVNGRFIAQPHADNGSGFCTACKGVIVADTAE